MLRNDHANAFARLDDVAQIGNEPNEPLKYAHGRFFNLPFERLMQAVACHDVGLAPENAGGTGLHIHQFEEAEPSLLVVEKRSTSDWSRASSRAVEPNI